MSKNPAGSLRVAEPEIAASDARHPFSTEQLVAIFNAPLYRGCRDDELGYATPGPNVVRRARFWVPLVGLFSGLRLNELCSLEVNDAALRDGVDCLVVQPDAEGVKQLKTKAAARVVPVHPELRRCGLLNYVAETRAAGHRRLFPELRPDRRGYHSDAFQKWLARYLRKASASAPRTSFHSFRHNFRDAVRESGANRDAVLALGGWAAGGTEETYGGGLRPRTLAAVMSGIEYPDLDLSHLWKGDQA